MSKSIASFTVAIALVLFTVPRLAHTGAPIVTAHPLAISLKIVDQVFTNGDYKPAKDSANAKDLFEECVGAAPARNEAIYLFISCPDIDNNMIAAINADTGAGIESVGSVTFRAPVIETTKNGVRTAASLPVDIELTCNIDTTTIILTGIMDMKFASVGGFACPYSASVKIIGSGDTPSISGKFLIGNGSSITVKKKSPTITAFPQM